MIAIPKIENALIAPQVITSPAPWAGHIPFAMWFISVLKPRLLVELGTYSGISYLSFCQIVLKEGLSTRCVAIDTWEGDSHAGYYGEHIYQTLRFNHDYQYSGFSSLLRKKFDAAVADFADQSIDFLHIDGLHTYDAVKHDFETWYSKLSSNAVVLFHDTNVYEEGFGVHKFWAEIKNKFPSFSFSHSNGLGILFVGNESIKSIAHLGIDVTRLDSNVVFKRFFSALGAAQERRGELHGVQHRLSESEKIRLDVNCRFESIEDALHTVQLNLVQSEKEKNELQQTTLLLQKDNLSLGVNIARLEADKVNLGANITRLEADNLNLDSTVATLQRQVLLEQQVAFDLRRNLSAIESDHQELKKISAQQHNWIVSQDEKIITLERQIALSAQSIKGVQTELESTFDHRFASVKLKLGTQFGIRTNLKKLRRIFVRAKNATRYIQRGDFAGLTVRMRAVRKDTVLPSKLLPVNATIVIISTQHTLFLATSIRQALIRIGLHSEIVTDVEISEFPAEFYFVICAQMFKNLPPGERRIVFQMEQTVSDRWFDDRYISILENSLAVFDYSAANLRYLASRGLVYPHVFHVPLGSNIGMGQSCIDYHLDTVPKTIDVLFYGDAHSPRRKKFLDYLKLKFNVVIIGNLFGDELRKKISSAKVVVNIHYYENALLESTRIFECLSLGTHVVSETAVDVADYPDLDVAVDFVQVGDAAAMAERVAHVLGGIDASKFSAATTTYLQQTQYRFQFMLLRGLLALGIVSFPKFLASTDYPMHDRMVLSLPETLNRRAAWLANSLPDSHVFDGLRARPGWIGCAMSYKYICAKALEQGLSRILVCEDDAEWPAAYAPVHTIIEKFLNKNEGKWDIFVGLISNLHTDAKVLDVEEYEGLTFVTLDKMTSMVFNIYSPKAMRLIANWDESWQDDQQNTIDRYLESIPNLRVVTLLEPLFGHREDQTSTLWGFKNTQYNSLIDKSRDLLREKVMAFWG